MYSQSCWYFGSVYCHNIFKIAFSWHHTDKSGKCRILGCQVLLHCLGQLAKQYQHVKFISMLSTDCIPDYPNKNLPTLLVYKDGQCKRTIVGLRSLGVDRISPESASSYAVNNLVDFGPVGQCH